MSVGCVSGTSQEANKKINGKNGRDERNKKENEESSQDADVFRQK